MWCSHQFCFHGPFVHALQVHTVKGIQAMNYIYKCVHDKPLILHSLKIDLLPLQLGSTVVTSENTFVSVKESTIDVYGKQNTLQITMLSLNKMTTDNEKPISLEIHSGASPRTSTSQCSTQYRIHNIHNRYVYVYSTIDNLAR